ncbi:endopeptidase La [Anaerosacchariphilus sp. NSJ-68]|uniref:Lon protease n=2 Tax=Lachnospiraceae TaxID=186803 RepID=A0A923RLU2_9FIRM|nr:MULTISPECIES: endopeptidase La [Lachnospiraceae]MBC5658691.1 endopeptidase La [Anaerosacchariphilus hominis]MBC5699040.1 endopeptidase La [Roseburia difficilis]
MTDLIETLPVIALRGMTILPDMVIHFDVSRERSIKAIEEAMLKDQRTFLVTQRDPQVENPGSEDLYRIGTIACVKQVIKMPHSVIRVLAEGLERAELSQFHQEDPYLEAEVLRFEKDTELQNLPESCREAMARNLGETFQMYCAENPKGGKELARQVSQEPNLEKLMSQIMINLPLFYEDKQKLLEADSLSDRYELLCLLMNKEIEVMRFKRELQEKVKNRVDKNQREYLLREELKVIREELGEDNLLSDADHFREEVAKLKASKEVREKLNKEISRFQNMGMNSSESAVLRGYIETMLELPWDKASRDSSDLKRAEEILNEDHYGMEKVKERVLEYLAVRILTKKGSSPILCLVGPPGTGKTSIARSIARALNKKYVRISLGGVRDEAEIRGHRRTYVGAMPGRIAAGMKQAGVKNPLMLLDEIDKVSSDYKGDTSSALLEVLDSEQNSRFQDHYVELPMDLSEVLFIATANDVQTIPRPLLDRMELIEVSSYTENEKVHIAREHLIGKQMEKNGLKEGQLTISPKALEHLIHSYTREAGVRQLERKLGEVCRKAAREILEQSRESVRLTENNLEKYLGKPRYSYDMANETDEVGIVRGLAWTSVGGDTLQIEVNIMPGKGEISLTGQLGDVMKESARTGLSYIRSVSGSYGIDKEFFREHDIHIHIPEGAVPKDGPSAGITMATAMLSAMTDIPVYAHVAMTGEITLRGRVLPIGGLKEKLLAAKNAGIKTVIVPEKNRRDVAEISAEIKKGLQIVYAEQMEDVLKIAFHEKA